METEQFGPLLHIARYRADQLEAVIDPTNATGHGLTFGAHSRNEHFTNQYGFVVDYLAEALRDLRKHNYTEKIGRASCRERV